MYRVILPRRVERQLEGLAPEFHPDVLRGMLALTGEPRPLAARKLIGYEHTWCAYLPHQHRVYYDIDDARFTVLILAITRSRLDSSRLQAMIDD